MYDTEGRFVPEKFEEIFSKFDRSNKGGLSWDDIQVRRGHGRGGGHAVASMLQHAHCSRHAGSCAARRGRRSVRVQPQRRSVAQPPAGLSACAALSVVARRARLIAAREPPPLLHIQAMVLANMNVLDPVGWCVRARGLLLGGALMHAA